MLYIITHHFQSDIEKSSFAWIQFPIINYNQMKTNGISPILTFPMVVSFPCFQPINTIAYFSFNNELSKIKIDESQKNHRQHFTHEEDVKIKILVETYGTKSWSVIALLLKEKMQSNVVIVIQII